MDVSSAALFAWFVNLEQTAQCNREPQIRALRSLHDGDARLLDREKNLLGSQSRSDPRRNAK
jgi:hypothetical protein